MKKGRRFCRTEGMGARGTYPPMRCSSSGGTRGGINAARQRATAVCVSCDGGATATRFSDRDSYRGSSLHRLAAPADQRSWQPERSPGSSAFSASVGRGGSSTSSPWVHRCQNPAWTSTDGCWRDSRAHSRSWRNGIRRKVSNLTHLGNAVHPHSLGPLQLSRESVDSKPPLTNLPVKINEISV